MELADVLKPLILTELGEITNSLPFHDRVLAWLSPSMSDDIARFHGGVGSTLDEMFTKQAIEHIDRELLSVLSGEIERSRPGTIRFLKELSSVEQKDDYCEDV